MAYDQIPDREFVPATSMLRASIKQCSANALVVVVMAVFVAVVLNTIRRSISY